MIENCKRNITRIVKESEADESDLEFLESIELMLERHFALKIIRKAQKELENAV